MKLTQGKKIYFASDNHLGAPNFKESLFREKKFVSWLDEIKDDASSLPYKIKKGKNSEVKIVANNKDYAPEQISAMLLQKLKQTAEEHLGQKVITHFQVRILGYPFFDQDPLYNGKKTGTFEKCRF